MSIEKTRIIAALLLLVSLTPVVGWAYGNGDGKRRMKPPAEAFEVCEGKNVGDSVEFTGRRGKTITATCEELNDQLVAVPEKLRERMK